jgi:hypothetical protein
MWQWPWRRYRRRPGLAVDPAVLSAFCARWDVADLEILGNPPLHEEVPIVVTFMPDTPGPPRAWRSMRDELAELIGRPVNLLLR